MSAQFLKEDRRLMRVPCFFVSQMRCKESSTYHLQRQFVNKGFSYQRHGREHPPTPPEAGALWQGTVAF